jgi:hypothetical protein
MRYIIVFYLAGSDSSIMSYISTLQEKRYLGLISSGVVKPLLSKIRLLLLSTFFSF